MIVVVIWMFTIDIDNTEILEVKKSKFIAILKRVDCEEDAKKIIENSKVEYPNAKHYTYAYIIDNVKKMSDDKEPSGTAGMPILSILEKKNLNHVICVVVRYFGGILLGAPGLVRAYSNSTLLSLNGVNIIPFIEYESYFIKFPYSLEKEVSYLLKNIEILNKEFNEMIEYQIKIPKDNLEVLENLKNLMIEIKKSD